MAAGLLMMLQADLQQVCSELNKLCFSTCSCNKLYTVGRKKVATFILGLLWQIWTDFSNSFTTSNAFRRAEIKFATASCISCCCTLQNLNFYFYTVTAVIRFKSGA